MAEPVHSGSSPIKNDSRLQDIRKLIHDKTISLEAFLKEYDTKAEILESVCVR